MRIVKELSVDGVRITVFSWNNKFLLKFEQGMVEQTYKVNETEILEERYLDSFFEGEFFDKVKNNFDDMQILLRNKIENL
ncbi:hypothetical protein [Anditalea andensis]|uniref:Uncharacterized protein n=1 Tax=Anditalea andensis TaxID=1048983 RepID=A0A074KR92_9BACT|nr:hypothetical protein [Anditalea andensis]KEO72471.1 hypothetical protein EL17_17180 [Anditalea andensis]